LGSAISEEPAISPVEKKSIANQMIGEWWMNALISLFETVGYDKSIQSLRPHIKLHGKEGWLMMKSQMNIEDDPLLSIAHATNIGTASAGLPSKTEIAERGVIVTIYDCPFARLGRDIFCPVHSLKDEAVCEAIDPDYTSRHIRWLTRGDPICQHVFIK
jgi:hypothetical protein